MQKLSYTVALLGFFVLAGGCGKATPASPASSRADRELERQEQLLEAKGRRAKQEIDDLTAKAEAALRKSHAQAKSKQYKLAQELAERAAELAEDAKDRAADLPTTIEDILDLQFESTPHRSARRYDYDE